MSQCIAIDIFVVKRMDLTKAMQVLKGTELCIESGTGQETGWLKVCKMQKPSQNQLSAIAAKLSPLVSWTVTLLHNMLIIVNLE